MALMRVTLTNGTNSTTLFQGTAATLREAGLRISAPTMRTAYLNSPFNDAELLTLARYSNRTIDLKLKIAGSSYADLQTNIRTIQRMLNDALAYTLTQFPKQGMLTSSGKLYLETQWGDVAAQSTYWEVVKGSLEMPQDLYSYKLINNKSIIDAVLHLEVKPFGFYTAQDLASASLFNYDIPASTSHNYTNISTSETYGDVSAKLYMTVNTVGGTGSTNTWIAKRSGNRQNDTLWYEAENLTSFTTLASTTTFVTIAQYSPGSVTNWEPAYGNNLAGQTFTSENANTTTRIDVWTSKIGTPSGSAILRLYPTAVSTGTPTATTPAITTASTSANGVTVGGWTSFTFSQAVSSSILLGLGLACSSGDASNYVQLGFTTAAGYGSGQQITSADNGTTWTANAGRDANFRVMYTNTSAVAAASSADAAASNGFIYRVAYNNALPITASTEIGYLQFNLASPPRGNFRVLARIKTSAEDYTDCLFGLGYSYATASDSPSYSQSEYYAAANGASTYQIIDLGLIAIPPIAESQIASNNTYSLRIYEYINAAPATGTTGTFNFDLDYLFLCPVDEGAVIIRSTGSTDTIAVDNISDPANVFKLDAASTAVITGYPDYIGAPFYLGRENTRIYVLRDDTITTSHTVNIKYMPLFLLI